MTRCSAGGLLLGGARGTELLDKAVFGQMRISLRFEKRGLKRGKTTKQHKLRRTEVEHRARSPLIEGRRVKSLLTKF